MAVCAALTEPRKESTVSPFFRHFAKVPPAQSLGYVLSRVFSLAEPLAQPQYNSRASARFDFPSARRSISRRASDSGRFSSLQIGTALHSLRSSPARAVVDMACGRSVRPGQVVNGRFVTAGAGHVLLQCLSNMAGFRAGYCPPKSSRSLEIGLGKARALGGSCTAAVAGS
jgi:hypothetical protein